MGSDHKDDLDLAARVAQGDAGAFNDFCVRHADLVFAFIYHLLNGARADAEEIWQDISSEHRREETNTKP